MSIKHLPHAILFEIIDGVYYHSLIAYLADQLNQSRPTMLGMVDKVMEEKPYIALTKLPLDS